MHVLVDDQHRLLGGQPFKLAQQRFERQLLLALRGQVKCRVALGC